MASPGLEPLDDPAALRQEAQRIQSSGVLGEARLRRLFDYLVSTSLEGQSPKEIAIAIDVFGKNADFDVAQDALVRLYIHKLRKALDDFYAGAGAGDRAGASGAGILHIPRGEYRLRVADRAPATAPAAASTTGPQAAGPPKKQRAFIYGASGAVLLAALTFAWFALPHTDLQRVRANPIWSAILEDDRPIMIVIGDYYLIGELDDSMGVKRLVREYSVNSKSDLESFVAEHPQLADRYLDVGIRYLPTSAASALRDVMVVLAPENRRISVSKMSDLEPTSLKSADIVYIGYLSGMGMFQDLAFTGSRFEVGESYDEIIDRAAKHSYVSDVGTQIMDPPQPTGKERPYHDYGIFTKFRGPGGNTILVISGTRDEGVSQTAEAVTSAQKLDELAQQSNLNMPLEALIDVSAFDGVNLSGKVLVEANRKEQIFR
jgi:hypothetical protein